MTFVILANWAGQLMRFAEYIQRNLPNYDFVLTVGFLLLQYSVLCTFESLSLLNISFLDFYYMFWEIIH